MNARRLLALCIAVAGSAVLVAVLDLRPATADRPTPHARQTAEPDRQSAVATATAFLTSIDLEVLLDDDRRNRVLARFAAPAALPALQRTYATEKRRVAASYMERPRLARAALAGFRVDERTRTAASVSIWAATIGGSGSFEPAAGWSTTTVDLAWDEGRWKVSRVRDQPGPSPDWPIDALAREARTFEEYRHAP